MGPSPPSPIVVCVREAALADALELLLVAVGHDVRIHDSAGAVEGLDLADNEILIIDHDFVLKEGRGHICPIGAGRRSGATIILAEDDVAARLIGAQQAGYLVIEKPFLSAELLAHLEALETVETL